MRAFLFTAAIFVICTINIQCTDTAEYYVSSSGAHCPDNTICHSLSFYNIQDNLYFTNDTVFYFLEGTHVLEQLLLIGLQNVTFKGIGNIEQGFDDTVNQSTVILTCNEGIGGVVFRSCENIDIKGITINNCSTNSHYEVYMYDVPLHASLAIYNSSNINIENVSIQNSSQNGLVMVNVLNMTVTKCSFARNAYAYAQNYRANIKAVFLDHMTPPKTWGIFLEDSNITSSFQDGLNVVFLQKQYTVNFSLQSVKFTNNHYNVYLESISSCHYNLQLNEVVSSGAHINSFYSYQYNCLSDSKPTIKITNSTFEYNYGTTFYLMWQTGMVSIESTQFIANNGFSIVSIIQPKKIITKSCSTLKVKLFNVKFKDNKVNDEETFIVLINNINDIMMTKCTFADNDGTGLLIYDSYVTFTGSNVFINNTGINGGAIQMQNALILLQNDTNISFINNHATNKGGAIYVIQNSLIYNYCFYQLFEPIVRPIRKYFHFQDNTAVIGGSAVYYDGGNVSDCYASEYGISVVDQTLISSNAHRICFCDDDVPNCSKTKTNVTILPGNSINFAVIAFENRNSTIMTTGLVQVRDQNAIQNVSTFDISASCTDITYSVQVTNSSLRTIDINVILASGDFNTKPNILFVRVAIMSNWFLFFQ